MAKYFKFIGDQKIVMTFDIPEQILQDKGWVKLVEVEEKKDVEIIDATKEVTETEAETPKPRRRRRTKKTQ